MKVKVFAVLLMVTLFFGAAFSFINLNEDKINNQNSILSKSASIKSANLNGCTTVNFDESPELGGKLATWVPFSNLVPLEIAAGDISIPFYLSSESGKHSGQISEIWDVEFFDAIPPNGDFQNRNEFYNLAGGNWPNDTDPSLVARTTLVTEDIPDGFEDSSYTVTTGSLGTVTLSRDVKFVRARLRPDVNFDGTPSSVFARAATICSDPGTPTPSCVNVDLSLNGVLPANDGSEGSIAGILRYSSNPLRNSEYSNIAGINLPAGEVTIPNFYAVDQNNDRETEHQDSERVAIEFLDAANQVVAVSDVSPDLRDGVNSAYFEGALGSVTLSEPVVGVRAVHRPNETSNQDTSDALNAPGATICFEGTPPPIVNTIEANPNYTITLTSVPTEIYELETMNVSIEVTNTGNIELDDIKVYTNIDSTGNYSVDSLSPGETHYRTVALEVPFAIPYVNGNFMQLSAYASTYPVIDLSIYHWPSGYDNVPTGPYMLRLDSRNLVIKRIGLPV